MKQFFENNDMILMEGAVVEILRRSDTVDLHPTLFNAPLIYDPIGRKEMARILCNYIDISVAANLPFLMCSPTWRANKTMVLQSGLSQRINVDAVHFMKEIRDRYPSHKEHIKIGGLIACKNDCYLPEQGLTTSEARSFHSWQVEELVKGGVDFLIAETLPNIQEALGIAQCFEKTGLPYMISFVISREGVVLDGTPLFKAIEMIDNELASPPVAYTVNCAYPNFLCAEAQPKQLYTRLLGYMANASSLDHSDLENSETLKSERIEDWGNEMLKLNREYGVKILGGCCGTSEKHLKYLINN